MNIHGKKLNEEKLVVKIKNIEELEKEGSGHLNVPKYKKIIGKYIIIYENIFGIVETKIGKGILFVPDYLIKEDSILTIEEAMKKIPQLFI